jgi:hypothetical protein
MSDIEVTSQLTLQQDIQAELRAAEQAWEQSAARLSKIEAFIDVIPRIKDGSITQLEATIRGLVGEGIKIPVEIVATTGPLPTATNASSIGQAFLAAQQQASGMREAVAGPAAPAIVPPIPPIPPVPSVIERVAETYHLKPKVEAGEQLARVRAANQAIAAELDEVAENAAQAKAVADEVEQVKSSGRAPRGGAGEESTGGGRSRLGYGLYRYLSIAFAAREVIGSAIDSRELGIESQLAGNSVEKQYAAEESFVKKFGFTNLLLDPTGSRQIERQRTIESAHFGEQLAQYQFETQRDTLRSDRELGIENSGGLERQKLEADERLKEAQIRLDDDRRNNPNRAGIREEANRQIANAESQRQSAIDVASRANVADQFTGGTATESRDKLLAAIDAANKAYDQAVKAINDAANKRNEGLDAKLQKQVDDAKEIRDIIVARAQAAQDRLNSENDIRIADIEGQRQDIRTRQTGNVAEADKAAFARKLSEETDSLNAKRTEAAARKDFEEAGRLTNQISELEAARPEKVAANNRRIDQEQAKQDVLNQIQRADIDTHADTATLRGQGREREAAEKELDRSIDSRVEKLRAEAAALAGVDNAESRRLSALADEEQSRKKQTEDALKAGFNRETQNNLSDIREATEESRIAADGQRYQARERAADARFNREERGLRQAGRGEEADAVLQERDAARAERATLRSEDTRRINERADVLNLRRTHRGAEAELEQLEEQHRQELFEAGGDPTREAAVNREHQERLKNFAQNNVRGVTQSSARDAYFRIQSDVLGDPTGKEAASVAAAHAQALKEIRNARPDPPAHPLHSAARTPHDNHDPAAQGHDPAKPVDPMKIAMDKFEKDINRFGEYVETLLAEAV